jgi:dipeptidyl aminopeptidase/acylaminoacyl peptidase
MISCPCPSFFRRACWLIAVAALILVPGAFALTPPLSSSGDATADELASIFRPFETNGMTLSPDGRYLAYTERKGEDLYLVLRDIEANSIKRVLVGMADVAANSGAREKTPANLTFLRWAAGNRLVFNLNAENVWSIAADGTDPKRLGDIRTFAPGLPPYTETHVGMGIAIIPPNSLTAAAAMDQPINVTAMSRGDAYVYIEASEKSLGEAPQGPNGRKVDMFDGTPRGVFRVEAATGKQEHWAYAPQSRFVLCDQEGYPRIILANRDIHNPQSHRLNYFYAARGTTDWHEIDQLVAGKSTGGFHVDPRTQFEEHSVPLGFGYDPNVLYVASNFGRDTFGIYGLDTKTWQRTGAAIETNVSDLINSTETRPEPNPLVFDVWQKKLVGVRYVGAEPATLWLDPELEKVQQALNAVDDQRRWEIVEWNEARDRFLVLATSSIDPGTYYVFHPDERTLDEVMSRAPWLTKAGQNPGRSFGFQTKAGVNLSGYLTAPWRSLLKRPPLVVLCHDGPWSRDFPGYNREAQALAQMGFMVLQVNYRGSVGFGRKHLEALKEGSDTVAIEDIQAAIDAVAPKSVDRRLIAIMGHGYGGYLALRAMQLHPTQFRCAIAWDAPTDLPAWVNPPSRGPSFLGEMRQAFFGQDDAKLAAISPLTHPDQIQNPVMIIEADTDRLSHGVELASALKRAQRDVTYVSLSQDEAADLPQARAALFRRIHEFLNVNIYDYAVKIGEVREKE